MKVTKNFLLLGLFTVAVITAFQSCGDDDDDDELLGNWIELNDYMGNGRSEAVAFTLGNVGYVGTGYNGDDRLNDFWAYDTDRNTWTKIAEFPGAARTGAVSFTAAGKGYVGTGWDGVNKLNDFWVYDPDNNSWDSIDAPDGPSIRYAAVAFSINDIGYVGTGYDGNTLADFYAYNPATNTWKTIANYWSKVQEAAAFVIDGKGYVCTGYKNGEYIDDFYMYDPTTDQWTPKRKISNANDDEDYDDDYTIIRHKAVAFTLGSYGYVATGMVSSYKNDVWEYHPDTDTWIDKTNFEGSNRKDAVVIVTEDQRAFITTGASGTDYFDDTWEFRPMDEYDEDD